MKGKELAAIITRIRAQGKSESWPDYAQRIVDDLVDAGYKIVPQDVDPHPEVSIFPACSECDLAYVLRQCMSLSQGWVWLWQRDCKHHKAEAKVVDPSQVQPA